MGKVMRLMLLAFTLLWGGMVFSAPPLVEPLGMPANSQIHRLVVNNFWETNCFILAGPTRQAIVIDPGDELKMLGGDHYQATGEHAQRILDLLTKHKLKLKYIILSHGHLDHIGSIGFLKKKTKATIMMHAGDVRPKGDPHAGCPKDTRMFEGGLPKVDRTLADGELIKLDGMVLQVIHTPGHSPGGISLHTRKDGRDIVFSGDTLLYHSLGRTNFRDGSGDEALLYKSIRERLFTLPEETIVLTGHYEFTTIGEEKRNNPFLNPPQPSEDDTAEK